MGYDKQQAKHEFTRWSESYDRSVLQRLLFGPSHQAIINRIKSVSADRPLQILDVGCGTGIFAERIRSALPNARVVGIDLVVGMLSKGHERWKRHEGSIFAVQADSERLPFERATFDIVTCANSFHHYPHQKRAVAEMSRVLRPNGRLMLVDGFRDRPWGWLVYDICVAHVEGAVHHASASEIKTMFSSSGMDSVAQTIHRGLAPFLLTEGVASATNKQFSTSRETVTSASQ